ncbi:uncharacterized protein LOC130585900 [Malurus melanocephalus]|uniref:uncharacterized protein LOC130585900 n=1 Tax=Malurus melanocephalus TaxID=175006 RepID=UPI0025478A68|nr:uncharacterized protein LOC130585900 [Malurus melanocephalus]
MGLGTIQIVKRPICRGEGEGLMVESPEFDLNKPFLVGKKFLHGNSPVPGLSKADDLVCAEVAMRLHKPKATIAMCIEATIKICEWALSSGQNFDFVFKGIGILVCRGTYVDMRFFESLVQEVAKSECLAEGLLQSPNLKPLFVACTEKDISQIPPGGVLVLPHFVQADGKSQPHPVNTSLQGTGIMIKINSKHQTTLGNFPSQRLLSRPRLSPSRIHDLRAMGRQKKKADGAVQRGSSLPPIEKSGKKDRATKGMEVPRGGLAASTRQGRHDWLPPLAEQRQPGTAAALHPGGLEKLRKERVAAVAGVAAAVSPERKEKKTPPPRGERRK